MAAEASTEAVSPVIATVVMVGITVVLTATVMLFVGGLSKPPAESPLFVPSREETSDRLVVVRADPSLPLARLRIEMSVAGHFGYNSLASSSSTALPANTLVPLGAVGNVAGGDNLYFCADTAASNVKVLVQDPITNRIVATDTFAYMVACT
ncbi:MAG TPA: type IV pilin N-terminal domain-containing protein [Candidatus Thermoplasmatota archaeon]|nr:type IV pilin N-terminal domain-containing protein [Candidatus Thermoplasmatota archaeon]